MTTTRSTGTARDPQRVLVHADGPARAEFFGKLVAALPSDANFDVTFVTESATAQRMLTEQGCRVTYLTGSRQSPDASLDALYEHSLCGVLGNMNRHTAAGYKGEVDRLLAEVQPDVIWCWNGTKFIDRCLKASGVAFKALEVANIPGHFVVEDDGVNAESATYRRLVQENTVLHAPEGFDYAAWKAEYIAGKEQQKTIPQASVAGVEAREKLAHLTGVLRTTPRFIWFQIDRILGYALRKQVDKRVAALAEARGATPAADQGKHVFFPQQVSSDSQLIFNAEYDNMSALRLLLSELSDADILLSNLHPAEHRLSRKLAFLRLCREDARLVPAKGGAWTQLKRADEVVTINSTVGLEATILDRPVVFWANRLLRGSTKIPKRSSGFWVSISCPIQRPIQPLCVRM